MRILWITNIPSPYRVEFFNELGKSCELTVLFEKAAAADRDQSWTRFATHNFHAIFLRGISYAPDSAACPEVLSYLRSGEYDVVIVTNFSSPTGMLAVAYLKATKRPYFLESDGGFPSGSWLKSWVKRLVIKGAQGYFSTSDVHDDYYLAYGAAPDKLIRYPFTSVRAADVRDEPPTPARKREAKRKLGVGESPLVLAVGQFIHRKGFDVLLKACSSLPTDTAVVIVGGEPTAEYRQIVTKMGLTSVGFVGFKDPEELVTYFTAADVFVLPSREDIWGLVVNEALAQAVPVVTTDRCVAGLELVLKGGTGIVVPVEDVDALVDALGRILDDDPLRCQMQRQALRIASVYTIERMARVHDKVLSEWIADCDPRSVVA